MEAPVPKKSTAKFTYTGNPGYRFRLTAGDCELFPGDVVELTADEASVLGDEFTKTTAAPAADPEGATP